MQYLSFIFKNTDGKSIEKYIFGKTMLTYESQFSIKES